MYTFKKELKKKLLNGRSIISVSATIGLSNPHLTNILNKKISCSKMTAYCIVKICNQKKEIEDYFVRES